MRNRVLAYALAASVGLHIAILCVVGRAYLSSNRVTKPVVDEMPVVKVHVVGAPDEIEKPKPVPVRTPEPKPQPKKSLFRAITSVFSKPPPAPKPAPAPPLNPVKPVHSNMTKPAGNPGGASNLGSNSSQGQNLGPSGHTPVGWSPGNPNSTGQGPGNGPGAGRPEPVPGATDGPGHDPAPPPPPPPPPPPDVDAKVCQESGMLPGPNCEHIVTRSFRPGHQPTAVCAVCKPKHVSTLADRSVPEMISGRRAPKYPASARDSGAEGSVTVEYTINTDGDVTGVKIASSSGNSDLDRAAVEAVQSRKYKPAVQGGIPRNYRKRETFHFALD